MAGGRDQAGDAGQAGDYPGLLIDGEVIDGEPASDRGLRRLGLDHCLMPGLADRAVDSTSVRRLSLVLPSPENR
jgi:hypothetical protein